jgi:glycosyltransferase involved in cell wall biosynthesis
MSQLISIIIPIYNADAYLPKCLDSVVNQTYKNLEIILVNDGSIDNSLQICYEYAKLDNRIKVINQENMGMSAARNVGLDIARGEYLGFVDSDDWLDNDMYECLLEAVFKNNKAIAMCDVFIEKETKTRISSVSADKNFLNANEIFLLSFTTGAGNLRSIWNKIYRKDLFADLRFKFYAVEDIYLFYLLTEKAEGIYFVKKPLYHYLVRSNSVTSSNFSEKTMNYTLVFEELQKLPFMKPYENSLKISYVHAAWSVLGYMKGKYGGKNLPYTKQLVKIIRENHQYIQNKSNSHFILEKMLAIGINYRFVLFIRHIARFLLRLREYIKKWIKRKSKGQYANH